MSQHFDVVIVGGGTGGLTAAAHLHEKAPELTVGIIEPNEKHYYQPIWTLVGGGVFPKEVSERDQKDFIPPGMTWIKASVKEFAPDKDTLVTDAGDNITYGQLVVAVGIQINWDSIPGLTENLGKNGVGSNYY